MRKQIFKCSTLKILLELSGKAKHQYLTIYLKANILKFIYCQDIKNMIPFLYFYFWVIFILMFNAIILIFAWQFNILIWNLIATNFLNFIYLDHSFVFESTYCIFHILWSSQIIFHYWNLQIIYKNGMKCYIKFLKSQHYKNSTLFFRISLN